MRRGKTRRREQKGKRDRERERKGIFRSWEISSVLVWYGMVYGWKNE